MQENKISEVFPHKNLMFHVFITRTDKNSDKRRSRKVKISDKEAQRRLIELSQIIFKKID